jgi:hypothetical protein
MEYLVGATLAGLVGSDLANSALPNAPVVPHVEPSRPIRSARVALAKGLHRAATVVAPTGEPMLAR